MSDINKASLLLGNGINRAFAQSSLDDLIEKVAESNGMGNDMETIQKLPFPMQIVAACKDSVDKSMKGLAKTFRDTESGDEQKRYLRELCSLPLGAILTTNYTYELEKALNGRFTSGDYRKYRRLTKAVNSAEKQSLLFQFTALSCSEEKYPPIWHIHGEAHYPSSIVMGHYYYGKQLRMIENHIPEMYREYSKAQTEGKDYQFKSWVDSFLLTDLYILGSGMDLSEADLWWLLCCKKRHPKGHRTVYITPTKDLTEEKELMLRTYDVEIKKHDDVGDDYRPYLEDALRYLRNEMRGND